MDIIEVEGLTKYYKKFLAVDNISFNVREGEFFGLLGPNGAGKTTTIRILTGLLKPSSGNIFVTGIDVRKNSVEVKSNIGIISETANPYLEMSAWDNLMFAGALHSLSREERRKRAEDLLKLLGLYNRRNEKVENFSKGLRKRVAIALALMHDPQVLFLDEPTSGLDVQSSRMIRQFLRKLNENGVTIFLTTHYIEEADSLCDRIGIIKNGKIIAIDSPENLKAQSKKKRTLEISFENTLENIAEEIQKLPNVKLVKKYADKFIIHTDDISETIKELVNFASKKNLRIVSLNTMAPSLEDTFVELTGLSSLELERIEQIGKMRKMKM